MTRHFCVLTHGRSGSTALVAAMAALPGVAIPRDQTGPLHQELLHHKVRAQHQQRYLGTAASQPDAAGQGALAGADTLALIDAFQQQHSAAGAQVTGFKAMPHQLGAAWPLLLQRRDIQFITLVRQDLAATVASFVIARERDNFARAGGQAEVAWTFTPAHLPYVQHLVGYLQVSQRQLQQVPHAIRLCYEDLLQPGFQQVDLDRWFGTSVRLAEPKGATAVQHTVSNWQEFTSAVHRCRQTLIARQASISATFALH